MMFTDRTLTRRGNLLQPWLKFQCFSISDKQPINLHEIRGVNISEWRSHISQAAITPIFKDHFHTADHTLVVHVFDCLCFHSFGVKNPSEITDSIRY